MATPGRVNPARTRPSVKTTLSDHARCWRNNEETGFLEPVWPSPPPDKCFVLEVARAYLPSNYDADIDKIRVSQGAFHKLYIIPSRTMSKSYLLRVAIPVEPFYKTESEVATMAYLRERTTIPIPDVVAWSSSARDSVLGFEWILMEMVDGVTLGREWDVMEFDDKMRLTKEFAYYVKQLLGLRFTLFGNICFADRVTPHIFSNLDETEDLKVLWHSDLSKLNILVDPITFKIKGIVDWESVSIVPAWEVNHGIPLFLRGAEVEEPPPLGSLPEEDEADLVEIRKDWDLGLLRKAYTEIVGPLFDTTAVPDRRLQRKRKLSASLATFEDVWRRTRPG